MKSFFAGVLVLAAFQSVNAQVAGTDKLLAELRVVNKDTTAWLRSGALQIGLTQGFLHNWPAGGEVASLAVNGMFSGNLTRLYHNKVWSNSLDASYSLFYAYSNRFVPRKVDDRINFTSKFGSRIKNQKNLYLTALFNFKSQFTEGYDYSNPEWPTMPTSQFLSPGYLTFAPGLEYRKGSDISLFLSPLAARVTLVDRKFTIRSPQGAFGVDSNENSRFEFGAYFSGRFQKNLSPTVNYKTRLDLYANYLAKDVTNDQGQVVKQDNPGNIDIFWDNLVSIKLGKHFNMNLALTAIYDNDVPFDQNYIDKTSGSPVPKDEPGTGLGWWQIKEVVSFGFVYKIGS